MKTFETAEGIKHSRIKRQKSRDKRLHKELIECGRYNGGQKNPRFRNARTS